MEPFAWTEDADKKIGIGGTEGDISVLMFWTSRILWYFLMAFIVASAVGVVLPVWGWCACDPIKLAQMT